MHHSARGSQYYSAAYRALQASYGMQTSISRKGNLGQCSNGKLLWHHQD
jgi:transposase InsO family protein